MINSIACTNSAHGRSRTIVAPVSTSLTIRAISLNVSCIATDTTDDVGSGVALFGAVILAMTDLTAVLTSLVFVITKGTVESSELTKLVAFQLILAFWNRRSLKN